MRSRLERRIQRELAEVDGAARFQMLPLWRARPAGSERQVFRAFVQINIAPRSR